MLLAIYLNDHLAAATAAHDLAKRAAGSNRDTEYGPFLELLAIEIEEDRESLLEIMRGLEIGVDRLKVLGGWWAEKLGRFKLNGRLVGYSPLSRVVELEVLSLGVSGKVALWRTLERLEPEHPVLVDFEVGQLARRAERQLQEIEAHRVQAVADAFAPGT